MNLYFVKAKKSSIFLLAFFCLNSSCTNSKKRISVEITQESCQSISEITSGILSDVVNSSVSQTLNNSSSESNTSADNGKSGYWCECYTHYVSKDLMNNFSIEELREIKKDNVKKIIVLSKLFQAHQEEIKNCIETTTAEKINNYVDFERKFNRKLNSQNQTSDNNITTDEHKTFFSKGSKTTIKMEKINGVCQIPTEVDGIPMHFIFDTGASSISISETEAIFLYKQGRLTDNDIRGTQKFIDANGDISEGTIIILKSVKIGERTLTNVEASVVHNLNAPLLFGQSALGKFGKISIDNSRNEITFE